MLIFKTYISVSSSRTDSEPIDSYAGEPRTVAESVQPDTSMTDNLVVPPAQRVIDKCETEKLVTGYDYVKYQDKTKNSIALEDIVMSLDVPSSPGNDLQPSVITHAPCKLDSQICICFLCNDQKCLQTIGSKCLSIKLYRHFFLNLHSDNHFRLALPV